MTGRYADMPQKQGAAMNDVLQSERQAAPWWREPWPWLLMAGPLLAVIGCVITIALAVTHFRGQAIVDDGGVKRGLVIEKPPATAAEEQQP